MTRAVLFGGGGVTHDADPELEHYLLTCLPERPRIGYIGAANADDPVRLNRVCQRFQRLGAEVRHLPMMATATEAEAWTAELNAIYVGGGKTQRLLEHWRTTGIDQVLVRGAGRGILLSGVSAGAVCWFEFAFWDGDGTGYRPLAGLGLFAGSCCPHFTTEPERADACRAHIAAGTLPDGYAIGDGAGLVLSADGTARAIVARPGSGVWRAERNGNAAQLTQLPPVSSRHV